MSNLSERQMLRSGYRCLQRMGYRGRGIDPGRDRRGYGKADFHFVATGDMLRISSARKLSISSAQIGNATI